MSRPRPFIGLVATAASLALLLLLAASPVAAKCNGATSCVECVMAEPFGLFSGDYCKWCPSEALNPLLYKPDDDEFKDGGSCYDISSVDAKGDLNSETNVGGCMLTSMDAEIVWKGWMVPRFPQFRSRGGELVQRRAMSLEEAEAFCANLPKRKAAPQRMLSPELASSELSTVDANTLSSQKKETVILSSITGDLLRLMRLRAVDPAWFKVSFPHSEDRLTTDVVSEVLWTAGEAILHQPINILRTAIGAHAEFSKWAYGAQVQMAEKGGSVESSILSGVTLDQLWDAYVRLLDKFKRSRKSVDAFVEQLKYDMDKIIQEETGTADTVVGHVKKGNSHIGAHIGRAVGYTILGLVSGGTVPVVVGAFDAAISLGINKYSEKNVDNKLDVLMGGIFLYEAAIRGNLKGADNNLFYGKSIICDITSHLPNHGCAPDHFCKREWVFLPTDLKDFTDRGFSRLGLCAPASLRTYANGARCLLHSDCESGYCHFEDIPMESRSRRGMQTYMSARTLIRGDQPIRIQWMETNQATRIKATLGECLRAAPLSDTSCEIISYQHKFRVCKDHMEIARRVKEADARRFSAQSEAYKKVYRDIFGMSSRLPYAVKISRWASFEKKGQSIAAQWADRKKDYMKQREKEVKALMFEEAKLRHDIEYGLRSSYTPHVMKKQISADDANPNPAQDYAFSRGLTKGAPSTYEDIVLQTSKYGRRRRNKQEPGYYSYDV